MGPTTRRRFVDWLLGLGLVGWFGSILYPVIRFLNPPRETQAQTTSVKVARVDEIPPNSAKIFPIGREPAILVRTPEGQFRAFSAVCTHLACTVQYRPDWHLIWCACHNGKYDLNGINIAGPPPRPLEPYVVNIKEGVIYVSRA